MKVVYLFPTVEEAKGFLLTEPKAPVFVTGVGMAAVAAATVRAVKSKKPHLAILAGLAGACDETLAPGTVVEVVREQVAGIPERYGEVYEVEPLTDLPAVGSFTVSCCGGSRGETVAEGDPAPRIENMEGAAFFAVCEALGVECAQLRAVSNRVGDPFESWHTDEALENLVNRLTDLTFEE